MKIFLLYHIIAFSLGVIMDWIIGDPYKLPHPIRLIGNMIGFWDRIFLGDKKKIGDRDVHPKRETIKGVITVFIITITTVLLTAAVIFIAHMIHFVVGIIAEAILTCYVLAAKSLKVESMKVYKALAAGDIEGARFAVSMIVGRDTASLDERGITRAAVETVAENTSDGVIAPLLYTFVGGPVLGMLYKSINTMDSMIGYRNDRYEYFGKCAARLDDVVNFIPARIGAGLMILAAHMGREFDGEGAAKIFKRDRYKSKSPNSAQTESVCAGALGVRLLGPTSYFGVVYDKPFIGDGVREIDPNDIKLANKLMYGTEIILFIICELIIAGSIVGLWLA